MNSERLSSVFWFVLGIAAMVGSARLGLGTTGEPGSGFMPFTAGAFVCLMAALVFAQSFEGGVTKGISRLWEGVYWRRSLAVGVLTLVYVLVLETLGFTITGFLFLVILMRGLEKLSWKKTLIISVVTLAVSYVVFKIFLKATLPTGIIGF